MAAGKGGVEIKAAYEREGFHQYMVLEAAKSHDLNMIAVNELPFVLPHEVRIFNGRCHLRYRIEGCQTMEVVYGQKPMSYETVRQIYRDLCTCVEGLREYLLPYDCLALQPDGIYWCWDREGVMFVLDPLHPRDIAKQITELTEYLMQHMDYEDAKASSWICRLYDRIRRQGASYELVTQMCRQESEEIQHIITCPEDEKKYTEQDLMAVQEMYDLQETGWGHKLKKLVDAWKQKLLKPEYLPEDENNKKEKTQNISEPVQVEPEEVQCREETTLLSSEDRSTVYLKAVTPGYENMIIREGSYMLGRQTSNCQYVVNAPGVSRIHARLTFDTKQVFVMDLHSRNGTYLNESQLNVETEQLITQGDQIRFGTVLFVLESM